jgi:hypothetical protein
VAVKTASVADVARLLLGYCLFMSKREVDLLHDLFGVLEGEPIAFRPADRLGICEGGPSVVRAVDIVPDAHGALAEVRSHHACGKLLHLFGMAG